MTLESTVTSQNFLADGVSRDFEFSFKAWEDEMQVIVTGPDEAESDVTGNCQILVYADEAGGIVTYPILETTPPLEVGNKITIRRAMSFQQQTDLVTAGRYDSNVVETVFDRLTAQDQQLSEWLKRAVVVAPASSIKPGELVGELLSARDQANTFASSASASASACANFAQASQGSAIAASGFADQANAAVAGGLESIGEMVGAAGMGIESVANEAQLSLVEEGTLQIGKIAEEGGLQYGRARQEADRAKTEADKARLAADEALAVTGIGVAGRARLGLVQIGDGIQVDENGVISVNMSTVVSTPSIDFPGQVGIGYAYDAALAATTGAAEAEIDYFEMTIDAQPPVNIVATDNMATTSITVTGAAGSIGAIKVVAFDALGNFSHVATHTFTKNAVALSAPSVLYPVSGATELALTPTINIEQAEIQGVSGYPAQTNIQIATDGQFENIVAEHDGAYITAYTPPALPVGTRFYVRARHQFDLYGWTPWGTASYFNTLNAGVNAPTIFNPTQGQTGLGLNPAISLSAFVNVGPTDTPAGTQIEVAADAAFAEVVDEYNGDYLVGYNVATALALETTYYARARHQGNLWGWSDWSAARTFTTTNAALAAPVLTSPAAGGTDFPTTGPARLALPEVVGQTVPYMQIQISASSNFATLTHDSGEMAFGQSYVISPALTKGGSFYVRARLRGSITGWTDWCAPNAFTVATAAAGDSWTITTSGSWTPPTTGAYTVLVIGGGGKGGGGAYGIYYGGDVPEYNAGGNGGNGGGGASITYTVSMGKGLAADIVIGAGGTAGGTGAAVYGEAAPGGGGGGSSFTYNGTARTAGGGGGGGRGGPGSYGTGPQGAGGGGGGAGGAGNAGSASSYYYAGGSGGGAGAGAGGNNYNVAGGAGMGSTGGSGGGQGIAGVATLRPGGSTYGNGGARGGGGGAASGGSKGGNATNGVAGAIIITLN